MSLTSINIPCHQKCVFNGIETLYPFRCRTNCLVNPIRTPTISRERERTLNILDIPLLWRWCLGTKKTPQARRLEGFAGEATLFLGDYWHYEFALGVPNHTNFLFSCKAEDTTTNTVFVGYRVRYCPLCCDNITSVAHCLDALGKVIIMKLWSPTPHYLDRAFRYSTHLLSPCQRG